MSDFGIMIPTPKYGAKARWALHKKTEDGYQLAPFGGIIKTTTWFLIFVGPHDEVPEMLKSPLGEIKEHYSSGEYGGKHKLIRWGNSMEAAQMESKTLFAIAESKGLTP